MFLQYERLIDCAKSLLGQVYVVWLKLFSVVGACSLLESCYKTLLILYLYIMLATQWLIIQYFIFIGWRLYALFNALIGIYYSFSLYVVYLRVKQRVMAHQEYIFQQVIMVEQVGFALFLFVQFFIRVSLSNLSACW